MMNRTWLSLLLVLFILPLLNSCAGKSENTLAIEGLKEEWGVEVTRVSVTANGYMIDFRYRVHNAAKARELFARANKPYLIDQASGRVLSVPNMGKVGPLRNSNPPKQGKIYWMFFNNLNGLIKPGSKVTVVIGDFRIEDLITT